jgi:hypothetical protein
MRNKHLKLIPMLYVFMLILGTIFYFIIPKENFVKGLSMQQTQELEDIVLNLEGNVSNLTQSELEKLYKVESWSFDYSGRDLNIVNPRHFNPVFIKVKGEEDNKIEVYRYSAPMLLEGIDFSEKFKGPDIELTDNKLIVKYIEQRHSYTYFHKDFTVTQFTEERADKNHRLQGYFERAAFYVKIPSNVSISITEKE